MAGCGLEPTFPTASSTMTWQPPCSDATTPYRLSIVNAMSCSFFFGGGGRAQHCFFQVFPAKSGRLSICPLTKQRAQSPKLGEGEGRDKRGGGKQEETRQAKPSRACVLTVYFPTNHFPLLQNTLRPLLKLEVKTSVETHLSVTPEHLMPTDALILQWPSLCVLSSGPATN